MTVKSTRRRAATRLVATVVAFFAAACSHNETARSPSSDSATALSVVDSIPTDTESKKSPDCVRGEPDALFALGSSFVRMKPGEATETVRATGPIALTVRHFGCTHYALDFEFTWTGGRPVRAAALVSAADMLSSLQVRSDYGPVIESLISAIRTLGETPDESTATISDTETLSVSTPAANALLIRYDVAL